MLLLLSRVWHCADGHLVRFRTSTSRCDDRLTMIVRTSCVTVKEKSAMERWESSLMSSTSLSQVFVHLSVIEASVAWSKSALKARCRICRRRGDGDRMLLCDGCDKGHHMYCLKPQMKVCTLL